MSYHGFGASLAQQVCEEAGFQWNESTGLCVDPNAAKSSGTDPSELARKACEGGGMQWDEYTKKCLDPCPQTPWPQYRNGVDGNCYRIYSGDELDQSLEDSFNFGFQCGLQGGHVVQGGMKDGEGVSTCVKGTKQMAVTPKGGGAPVTSIKTPVPQGAAPVPQGTAPTTSTITSSLKTAAPWLIGGGLAIGLVALAAAAFARED